VQSLHREIQKVLGEMQEACLEQAVNLVLSHCFNAFPVSILNLPQGSFPLTSFTWELK
jgi:hypothetical protein